MMLATQNLRQRSLILIFLALLLLPTSAFSARLVVTKIADTNDGVCDTDCSLREAISIANSRPSNDEISFSPTVFSSAQVITLNGQSLRIQNNGGLAIMGPGPSLLSISGANATRVIVIENDATALLSGLTVRDGNGLGIGAGGGVVNLGRLDLNNSVVRDNFGQVYGGGIYNQLSLQITESVITNNNGDLYGGGISNLFESGLLTIYNSTISYNNVRRDGGGFYNTGTATIIGTTINNNTASSINDGGNGGGFLTTGYQNRNSSVTVINSTIANNICRSGGGGIMNDGSVVNLRNATISGNTFTNPQANYYGGGIVNFQINYPGTVTSINSIIADNTAANGQAPDFGGVLTNQGNNLIESTNLTAFTSPPTNEVLGQDPKLGLLTNNGGSVQTCALLVGSPAIDRIITTSLVTDQRYFYRPADGDGDGESRSDIGAFEATASPSISVASVSGRISVQRMREANPAVVSITNNYGSAQTVLADTLGNYSFTNVIKGYAYIVSIRKKGYSFHPRVIFVTGNVSNFDFSTSIRD